MVWLSQRRGPYFFGQSLEVWHFCHIFVGSNKQTHTTMETMKLNNGKTAIAKRFMNRTQAEKAKAKIEQEYGIKTWVGKWDSTVWWLIIADA